MYEYCNSIQKFCKIYFPKPAHLCGIMKIHLQYKFKNHVYVLWLSLWGNVPDMGACMASISLFHIRTAL
jgi:hypothetical protein